MYVYMDGNYIVNDIKSDEIILRRYRMILLDIRAPSEYYVHDALHPYVERFANANRVSAWDLDSSANKRTFAVHGSPMQHARATN